MDFSGGLYLCTVCSMRDLKITKLSDEFGQYVIYVRCEYGHICR